MLCCTKSIIIVGLLLSLQRVYAAGSKMMPSCCLFVFMYADILGRVQPCSTSIACLRVSADSVLRHGFSWDVAFCALQWFASCMAVLSVFTSHNVGLLLPSVGVAFVCAAQQAQCAGHCLAMVSRQSSTQNTVYDLFSTSPGVEDARIAQDNIKVLVVLTIARLEDLAT
jgi:hypothetical protein